MKKMKGTENLVGALEVTINDYESKAEQAKQADGKLYVGAGENFDSRALIYLIKNSDEITSRGNDGAEPAYTSLKQANEGRNLDGTKHPNYIVMDVNLREVVDLVNREGNTLLPENFVVTKHLSGHDAGVGYDIDATIKLLRKEMGNWVLMDKMGGIYASMRCRCPCFDGDVFYSKEDAEKEASSLKASRRYEAQQITPKFLINIRKKNQETIAKREAERARENLRVAEMQEAMPGVDYKRLEESLKNLPKQERQKIIDSVKKTLEGDQE